MIYVICRVVPFSFFFIQCEMNNQAHRDREKANKYNSVMDYLVKEPLYYNTYTYTISH